MNQLQLYWVLLHPSVKLALWVGFGLVLTYGLWWILPARRIRHVISPIFIAIYFFLPSTSRWLDSAFNDFRQQKETWLATKCREIMSSPTRQASGAPHYVDGFLHASNFDKLQNDRFQRVASAIAAKSGSNGTLVIDTGKYASHPIYRAVRGGTFAAMAYDILTQKRFSYVEFEMTPEDRDGNYSNAGHLDSRGWSGNRYRLYYLAPSDHPNCVNETGEGQISGVIIVNGGPVNPIVKPENPFCLTLEVTTAPISKYHIMADELQETVRWEARLRGIAIPAWIRIRWDRIRVTHQGDAEEIGRYRGFDYPNEESPTYKCNSDAVAESFLGSILRPDPHRAFLRAKSWYEGSAVQRFYESR